MIRGKNGLRIGREGMGEIPVVVAGITGKTGEAVGKAIHQASDMCLVGAIAARHAHEHLGARWNDETLDLSMVSQIEDLDSMPYAVLVDFTEPESAAHRIQWAVSRRWDIVVGTTGFSLEHRRRIEQLVDQYQVGAALIANFSIGAWFLERMAVEASRLFEVGEVIEAHHASKRDRPSGTAKRMASLLAESWRRQPEDIPVHSIRLPGLVAHQTVIFGAEGQLLTFRHDVHDRSAYGKGVVMAIRKIHEFRGRVVSDLTDVLS